MDDPDGTEQLRHAMDTAVARELVQAPAQDPLKAVSRENNEIFNALQKRRTQLDKLGPQVNTAGPGLELGADLYGKPYPEINLSLKDAIRIAVEHNLGTQVARLQQGVTQAELVAAQAAFDASIVANTQTNISNAPNQDIAAVGIPVDFMNQFRQWSFSSGIQAPLVTGGQFSATVGSLYSSLYPTSLYTPNPAWINTVQLGLSQPLLQGFGTDVNMASIRISRNNDRRSMQLLRSNLLSLCRDVEAAYWQVVVMRQRVVTAQWLVRVGIEVRDVLTKRRGFDATLANYADAVAKVEDRKSSVIRAQREVTAAVDRLKVLLNDPNFPVGDETMIVPTDFMVDEPLAYSLKDAIGTAVDQSPLITQALLAVDDASIRQVVADNGRLPSLNLTAQIQFQGMDQQNGNYGQAWSELGTANFMNYLIGANFSQPIGNRAPEANYRKSRLERSKTVIAYRAAIQQVIFLVKDSLRSIDAQYRLIEQTRAYRLAQAENMRALMLDEQTITSLSPEFLNLKFQRQNELASAQVQEVQSLADYNNAIASLWMNMGTGLQMNRIELRVFDPDPKDTGGAAKRDTANAANPSK
ncbi:MAG: TolC family protein [Planctomycetes bacterium]|nr:TolC family protein [Planctomycetota bacterium]